MKKILALIGGMAALAVHAEEYRLDQLLRLAADAHPAIAAVEAQRDAAVAALDTATAFPNPEIEWLGGTARARQPGTAAGNASSLALTQRIDYPHQVGLRRDAAGSRLQAVEAGGRAFRNDLAARVKLAYYEVLRRQAELAAAVDDARLIDAIRDRVAVRVRVGEAPRYELIKADAELLNAQKTSQSAQLRVIQAKAALRQAVGSRLPRDYGVAGDLEGQPTLPSLDTLRAEVLAHNPELAGLRALGERAGRLLDYERSLRLPQLSLRATVDEDPDLRTSKVGIGVTIPIWDRRSGPIGEAAAELRRSRAEQDGRAFELGQELEAAYQQFQIAQTQVAALESGIVPQAEAALRVAEAAYRFGERGILDYLDAQRVYRSVRSDLIGARHDLAAAAVAIERLRGLPPMIAE